MSQLIIQLFQYSEFETFFKKKPPFFYFGACVKYDFSEKANVRGNISLPLLQKRNQS